MRVTAPTALIAATGGALLGPAILSLGPFRRVLAATGAKSPILGRGTSGHLALTFDDGPDPVSTPLFMDLLAAHHVQATFFVLGKYVRAHPQQILDLAAAGHEIAVHGWDHQCVVLKRPGRLYHELGQTCDVVEELTGERPRWYRPPYGVVTTESLLAARRQSLSMVLWSAWGRDWERRATTRRIVRTVTKDARPGGTVLLHDTDRTSAPQSWRRTLAASEILLEGWDGRGQRVGPLRDHW